MFEMFITQFNCLLDFSVFIFYSFYSFNSFCYLDRGRAHLNTEQRLFELRVNSVPNVVMPCVTSTFSWRLF